MQTLAQLNSGKYSDITHLTLSENLTEFPQQIFSLASSLEVLDLSGNQLSALPIEFSSLQKLRILFLTNNNFNNIPAVLAACPQLEMISFKGNQLSQIDENVLPITTRWLILTDNKITALPHSMGKLTRLQKFALAGNQLQQLPDSMKNCKNLALIRLSANQLTMLPDWLFQLPSLAWLAFSGNKLANNIQPVTDQMPSISPQDFQLKQKLGEGASGVIYQAAWLTKPTTIDSDDDIAVKLFKGEITSDGYPIDELNNCLQAGEHKNLIKVIAKIMSKEQLALIMELIPARFYNLGLPPSLITCTRDTFAIGATLTISEVIRIVLSMADALRHLHENKVSHGDIYAHNTMVDEHANMLFGDFGAASNLKVLPETQQIAMQAIEVRAFGCLLDDLLPLSYQLESTAQYQALEIIKESCMQADTFKRPTFIAIVEQLKVHV
ncbi:leucine-rich repeat-containing protein kinase family protein [Colwellia hornerae]|uniref:Protein kinase n=1 Tax=Colwellia hornerae TaxID=89402 RepID=A0A5C6QB08_9GAMM|nr:leucine-rich repeat-containing protein kinase family protein [Colwellia hornerae]TWX59548.1 protein kinase [Colwellia hornerae]TWX62918.1 protein kinase [Colwellia hornerae]TWX65797.1 protein kinase [Colwellia hornerae]